MNYLALSCIVKDENAYLSEWIDYHSRAGVEQFYIYDNDSQTPIAETLKEKIANGNVVVERISGRGMQFAAYNHCLNTYGSFARWIGFIDTDEFLVPHETDDLKSMLVPYERFGGLGVNWLVFGSSGFKTKPDGLQIENFKLRSPTSNPVNTHIKSIVQPKYTKSVAHDPHSFFYTDGRFCVNENFIPITGPFSPNSVSKIQLNHYFLRSEGEFQEKISRGRGDGAGTRSMAEFHQMDTDANSVEDNSILRFLPL